MDKGTRYRFATEVASQYGRRLRRFFALRLRNEADAPDLAQEVFLRLMRVEQHETIRSPEAYLFTVASHVLSQHALRQANTPLSIEISEVFAELQPASAEDPMLRASGQQRLAEVQRVLGSLPPKVAATLMLQRFVGLSIEEICGQLEISRPAAKKYLARALAECRGALEGDSGVE
ncbi:MAG TPA: RNA polymerase sigma factor [Steroidobacteraceae bacterium]|nr:RNA polymerase sigma factor [Steroidobacteraceae bacterium]